MAKIDYTAAIVLSGVGADQQEPFGSSSSSVSGNATTNSLSPVAIGAANNTISVPATNTTITPVAGSATSLQLSFASLALGLFAML